MVKAKNAPVSRRWLVRDFNYKDLQWYAESDLFLKAEVSLADDMYEVRQNGEQKWFKVAVGEVFLRKVKRAYTFHLAERPSAVFYHPTARKSFRYSKYKKIVIRPPTKTLLSSRPESVETNQFRSQRWIT